MKRLAFLLILVLLVAACSGDDSGGASLERSTTTAAQGTTTTAENSDSSGDTTNSTAEPADSGTETTAGGDGDGDEPSTTVPPTDSGPDVAPCEAPADLTAYCTPFILDQGETRIVWDRWFWGQGIFSKGTVEIYTNDALVASGAFSGASSIMEQGSEGEFIFYNEAGDVVAIATQDELAPAIVAILEAEGIG